LSDSFHEKIIRNELKINLNLTGAIQLI